MVWLKKILFLLSCFYCFNVHSINLNEEEIYFNFIDLNNNDLISYSEVENAIKITFQLIDLNQDGFISKDELNELKNILNSLK
tara:strand:+ start:161 stop:409 length:249 start_codon:yes stop_codon:yes gene_type:complete